MSSIRYGLILLFITTSLIEAKSTNQLIQLYSISQPDRQQAIIDSLKQTQTPLIDDSLVTFFYIGDGVEKVSIAGDFNSWNPETDTLTRVLNSDFFVLSKYFESDARLDYKLILDGTQWILDPQNPHQTPGGFGINSEIAMPDYVQPVEILPSVQIDTGVIETHKFISDSLKNERKISVYLPAGYPDSEKRYPVLFVHDGSEYQQLGSMIQVLDNMIHTGKIPGLIVVFVDAVNRNLEYRFHAGFEHMMVRELVPFIDSLYRTKAGSQYRGMMGASLGGLVSAGICIKHPDLFGFCAAQSGAFWIDKQKLLKNLETLQTRIPVFFYLDWGSYEKGIQQCNIDMTLMLDLKEIPYLFAEYHEGHSWGSWRAHIDDILISFFTKSRILTE